MKFLSYDTLAVGQKNSSDVTPHGDYHIAPLSHFAYLPLIGKAHQIYKEFKEQFVFLTQMYGFPVLSENCLLSGVLYRQHLPVVVRISFAILLRFQVL